MKFYIQIIVRREKSVRLVKKHDNNLLISDFKLRTLGKTTKPEENTEYVKEKHVIYSLFTYFTEKRA